MTGFWFIAIVTTLYFAAAVAFEIEGRRGLAWMHFCYALANLGVLWIVLFGSK